MRGSRLGNLTLLVIAAPAGCLTLILMVGVLALGIWLDAQAETRGPFTIGLLVLSIPLNLYLMLRLALWSVRLIQRLERRGEQHAKEEES